MIKTVVLSLCFLLPSVTNAIECITSNCYVDVYTRVEPDSTPILQRVDRIYHKLAQTIGTQQAVRSNLLIIESTGFPWAVALGDNTVVITTAAIERMYHQADLELGDARASFVLGHELSHLVTDDLFHHRYFVFNQGASRLKPDNRPDHELRADLRGFTIATLAGYQTHRLTGGKDDFFRRWLSQLGTQTGASHPSTETRRQYLQDGFQEILDDVPYYRFAVALAHFGHYEDAELLLVDSLNKVETAEAYSNLGYVHLQRARAKMPIDMAYKYWFPTLLEPQSTLTLVRERTLFEQEMPEQVMELLERAENNFKYAITLDQDRITNHINLAAVYMYMPDKLHRAYSSIEDAVRTPLGRSSSVRDQLESIYQLIRVRGDNDNPDRWPLARSVLKKLADDPNAAENLIFNFARMLDNHGRGNSARMYWERLYANLEKLPPAYQGQVCFRLIKEDCGKEKRRLSPWRIESIPLGKDIRLPEVAAYFKEHWNAYSLPPKNLPYLSAQVLTNKDGDSLIALDNHIEMMIKRSIPAQFATVDDLQQHFGLPEVSLPLGGGVLLSFSSAWSAYTVGGKVKEIWVAQL